MHVWTFSQQPRLWNIVPFFLIFSNENIFVITKTAPSEKGGKKIKNFGTMSQKQWYTNQKCPTFNLGIYSSFKNVWILSSTTTKPPKDHPRIQSLRPLLRPPECNHSQKYNEQWAPPNSPEEIPQNTSENTIMTKCGMISEKGCKTKIPPAMDRFNKTQRWHTEIRKYIKLYGNDMLTKT